MLIGGGEVLIDIVKTFDDLRPSYYVLQNIICTIKCFIVSWRLMTFWFGTSGVKMVHINCNVR